MEYASIYDLKSYVAFFMSKFDKSETWDRLWYLSQSAMFDDMNNIIDPENPDNWYIKLRIGEFDVFFDNWRSWRIWREPTKWVKDMYKMWNDISYEEMLTNINIIMNCWSETPLTVIYWTVKWWKIVDLRDGLYLNNTYWTNSKWEKNRHLLRNEFWSVFMPEFNKVSDIYKWRKIEDHGSSWFTAKSRIPEARYCFTTSWNYAAVELSMSKSEDKDYNKKVYDFLFQYRDKIEKKFWDKLLRERLDNKIMSRISYRLEWVNVYDKNQWEKIMEFLSKSMIKFDNALKEYIELFNKN